MKQKSLSSLTVVQILNAYPLPHRFLAYFASQCAKDALSRVKDPDPRSLAAVSMAEAFGNGQDFTQEEMEKVRDDAYAAHTAAYAAYYAAYAADAADDLSLQELADIVRKLIKEPKP